MKTIAEASRKTPVLCETDVVVIGGGAAGIGAALSSARSGAKTVLIERYSFLGGCQTLTFNPSFSFIDDHIQGGVVQELIDKLIEGKAILPSNAGGIKEHWSTREGCYYFDAEYYKRLLDILMAEAGVKMLYYSYAVDAAVEGGSIKAVVIETMEGRQAVLCKSVIDCTGIAELAWRAGAECEGEEGYPDDRFGPFKGQHMGFGYGYYLRNLDYKKFREFAEENPEEFDGWVKGRKLFQEEKATGRLHSLRDSLIFQEYEDGRVWMLSPGYSIPKGRHPWEADLITEATVDMRRQAWSIFELCRERIPGFEKTEISVTPTRLMFRDSHRIVGEYKITEKDIYSGRTFEDSIACCNMPPDYFYPNGSHKFDFNLTPYDVPYRSIISKDFDNLLAAGGAISMEFIPFAALRYCVPAMCVGQAAGTAAALASKEKVAPKNIEVSKLQSKLASQGFVTTNKNLDPALVEMYRKRTKSWGGGFGM
ncbi:MAG: FAD-dependent oxidoreductase [Clostridiales Family XIII bacterium]|jgi:hypothetical protein|nr:FAD-dependent oxidoreductase [Clostridiales Family XIII bacterium]